MRAGLLLQGERDQVAKSAARERILIGEEPVIRVHTDIRPTLHGLRQYVRTKSARQRGGQGLVEEQPDMGATATPIGK